MQWPPKGRRADAHVSLQLMDDSDAALGGWRSISLSLFAVVGCVHKQQPVGQADGWGSHKATTPTRKLYSVAALMAIVAPAMRVKATSRVDASPPTATDSSSSGTSTATAPNAREVADRTP